MAFIPYSDAVESSIEKLKIALRDKLHVPVTFGYGPRFLHSTGQLHKGGSNKGFFLQFTSDPVYDLDVPGEGFSFGTLITAQAQGDLKALRNNGRKVISIHLSGDLKERIDYFISLLK
jgi:transaldolase/glucose-6-phosphate isomerase